MSIEILNTLNGLSKVVSELCYDGAHDSDGNPVEIGLKREEGHNILDSRVIDGFNIKVFGDKLCISYHMEDECMKSVHERGFESNIDGTVSEVKSFIEKQFRKNTGKALSLKEDGDILIDVTPISNRRIQIKAKRHYTVGALSEVEAVRGSDPSLLDKSIKDFLSQKNEKRAKNDKAQQDKSTPFDPARMSTGIRK